jgi:hypothetical protein
MPGSGNGTGRSRQPFLHEAEKDERTVAAKQASLLTKPFLLKYSDRRGFEANRAQLTLRLLLCLKHLSCHLFYLK